MAEVLFANTWLFASSSFAWLPPDLRIDSSVSIFNLHMLPNMLADYAGLVEEQANTFVEELRLSRLIKRLLLSL